MWSYSRGACVLDPKLVPVCLPSQRWVNDEHKCVEKCSFDTIWVDNSNGGSCERNPILGDELWEAGSRAPFSRMPELSDIQINSYKE